MVSQIEFSKANINALVKEGAGPTVLFIHGFPDSSHVWAPVLDQLANPCIAIDLPGVAGSVNATPESFHVLDVAAYLYAIIARSNEPIYLVGHDFGAAVASAIAAGKNKNIAGLTIVNGPYPRCYQKQVQANAKQQAIFKYAEIFAREDAVAFIKRKQYLPLSSFYFDQEWISEADKQSSMELWKQDQSLRNALLYYKDNLDWFKSGNMDDLNVNVPLSVFWGLKDHALVEENVKDLDQFVGKLTVHTVANAGHWSFRSHLEEFTAFLNQQLKVL